MASAPMTTLELVSRAQLLYRNPKTKSRLFSVGILYELRECGQAPEDRATRRSSRLWVIIEVRGNGADACRTREGPCNVNSISTPPRLICHPRRKVNPTKICK